MSMYLSTSFGSLSALRVHTTHAMPRHKVRESVKRDGKRRAVNPSGAVQEAANATRVADANDPGSMPDVLVAQAKVCVERSEFTKAEALYVRAKKPELAVRAYKEANRWSDATRIAREFLPHRVAEITAEHNAYLRGEVAVKEEVQ